MNLLDFSRDLRTKILDLRAKLNLAGVPEDDRRLYVGDTNELVVNGDSTEPTEWLGFKIVWGYEPGAWNLETGEQIS